MQPGRTVMFRTICATGSPGWRPLKRPRRRFRYGRPPGEVGGSWQRIAATALVGIAVGILFAELALSPGDDSALLASAIPEPGMLTAELEAPLAGDELPAEPPLEITLAPDLSAISFTGIEQPPMQQISDPSAVTQLLDDGIGSVADLPLL